MFFAWYWMPAVLIAERKMLMHRSEFIRVCFVLSPVFKISASRFEKRGELIRRWSEANAFLVVPGYRSPVEWSLTTPHDTRSEDFVCILHRYFELTSTGLVPSYREQWRFHMYPAQVLWTYWTGSSACLSAAFYL
jgi:hypothetical protein